jgi:hypothetical protein
MAEISPHGLAHDALGTEGKLRASIEQHLQQSSKYKENP